MPRRSARLGSYGFFICALCGAAACESRTEAAPPVARAPAKSGEVWELDRSAGRETSPAALLAYVNGLHVLLLDGNDAYAGMTRLRAEKGSGGARTIALADGLSAELVPSGDAMELRFSTGESIPMRRREPR